MYENLASFCQARLCSLHTLHEQIKPLNNLICHMLINRLASFKKQNYTAVIHHMNNVSD
jgi:hypothetical protein